MLKQVRIFPYAYRQTDIQAGRPTDRMRMMMMMMMGRAMAFWPMHNCSKHVQKMFTHCSRIVHKSLCFLEKIVKKIVGGMTASLTSQNESTLRIKILNESTLK